MHSEVTLDAGQLEDFGFTTISGSGDEFHILNIVGEGLVDLTGTGNATLKINGETIELSLDSPVFKGATLTTGPDSHIEVRFIDDTMLSQSEKTEISIDNYVYDQPDSAPALLLKLSEGTLRSITGKIAEENPESFQLESPLASIGIRGTDFTFIHDPSTGSRVVLNQISENHILLVNDQYGNIRYLNDPSTFVAVLEDRPISTVEFLSQAERDELLLETPFTTLENNGIEDGDADPDAPTLSRQRRCGRWRQRRS